MSRIGNAAAVGLVLWAAAAAAEPGSIGLGGDARLSYRAVSLLTVDPLDTLLAFRVDAVETATGTRPATREDFARACAVVVQDGTIGTGRGRADYVAFQTVTDTIKVGPFSLAETEEVYFETRLGHCRPLKRAPDPVQ